MRRGLFLGIATATLAVALSFFFLEPKESKETLISEPKVFEKNMPPLAEASPIQYQWEVKTKPVEDPDIFLFIRALMASRLTEDVALKLLRGQLSQNKKAVVLETYNELGGLYRDEGWAGILRELLLGADEWPELANEASQSLRRLNSSGELDDLLLQDIRGLSPEEEVKRAALADAIFGRPAVEAALAEAFAEAEIEILVARHASLMSQDERLRQFEAVQNLSARSEYLKTYIAGARSLDEMKEGLNKGLRASELTSEQKTAYLFSVAESRVAGKSLLLFDTWRGLLPRAKEQGDFIGMLNLALREAAYSEQEKSHAEGILQWLLSQPMIDPTRMDDPRIDLAIAMVNACGDAIVKKDHCKDLHESREALAAKLKKDGLGAYID
jgi:hypothetical protein